MIFIDFVKMMEQCNSCPYLIRTDDCDWVCDMKPNTTCMQNYLQCKEEEADEQG